MATMELGNIKSTINSFLSANLPQLKLAYIFGSTAQGKANKESDVDVAILCQEPLDAEKRFELQCELANLLNKDVDLVDLRMASEVMRAEILKSGKNIFAKDPDLLAEYEMYVCSRYAHLNEERAGILEDFYQGKNNHGG